MTAPRPDIISHDTFRPLSHEFFKPYPPYVLVNSREDADPVLSAGCEPGYLLVLDAEYVVRVYHEKWTSVTS